MLVLWSYGITLALIGIACGYFLALIPIVVLVTIGIILLFLILKGPHPAESGIGALFMAAAVLLVMVSIIITAVVVGTIPLLPLAYSAGQTADKIGWSWLFR